MAFEIRWDTKARDFLRKADKQVANRIVKKVDAIKDSPELFLDILKQINSYKLRVGDWRAIIDVDWNSKILFVRYIGHRENIYKRYKPT